MDCHIHIVGFFLAKTNERNITPFCQEMDLLVGFDLCIFGSFHVFMSVWRTSLVRLTASSSWCILNVHSHVYVDLWKLISRNGQDGTCFFEIYFNWVVQPTRQGCIFAWNGPKPTSFQNIVVWISTCLSWFSSTIGRTHRPQVIPRRLLDNMSWDSNMAGIQKTFGAVRCVLVELCWNSQQKLWMGFLWVIILT